MIMLGAALFHPAGAQASEAVTVTTDTTSYPYSSSSETVKEKPSAADVNISRDEAVAIVRSLFPQLEKAQADQVELGDPHTYPPRNELIWTIHWTIQKENGSYGFSSQVDAMTGDILQVHIYEGQDSETRAYYPPKVTREEAEKIAKAFIPKAAPSLASESLELDERASNYPQRLFGPVRYHFSYQSSKNGIPVPFSSVNMEIDGNGRVLSFNSNSQISKLPEGKAKVSQEEAEAWLEKQLQLELVYTQTRKDWREGDWMLAYYPARGNPVTLDALSGEPYLDKALQPASAKDYQQLPESTNGFKARAEGSEPISAEQAIEIVGEVVELPEDLNRISRSLDNDRGENSRKVWRLRWDSNEGMTPFPMNSTWVTVDAVTGQLYEFRNDSYRAYSNAQDAQETEQKSEEGIGAEAAADKALDWIHKLYPNAASELRWTGKPEVTPSADVDGYAFMFQRYYKDTAVMDDYVRIYVSGEGKLESYWAKRTDNLESKLTGLTAEVTADEAKQTMLDASQMHLTYLSDGGYHILNGSYVDATYKLVYSMKYGDREHEGTVVNASTGKLQQLYTYGMTKPVAGETAKDIAGHWAEAELEDLVQHGVLAADEQGLLNPNQAVTIGEWYSMISKAMNGDIESYYYASGDGEEDKALFADVTKDSPYYQAVRWYSQRYQIKHDPERTLGVDQTLTRERFAELLMPIVHYDKLAQALNDSSDLSHFSDAESIRSKGAVALASGLGLLEGSGGAWRPNDEVTRAQAAVVMMRLVYLQGKVDQAIDQY
ncbi:YcdB/YcdC domain-containing protein [Paenibacillus turpanensis]|uniref:YcdB/YcdC domain-containing protein n=1 Tax=Paenibacillus turpanensis TaxID=2689078 RepID=UPI001409B928|nr:YcdB/YcdC domain-containing protein [Paenibacillus turpanensis]